MDREAALKEIKKKAGELEEFLMNDISINASLKKKKAVDIVDPNFENTKITAVVSTCQFLVQWCAEEIAKCKAKRKEERKKENELFAETAKKLEEERKKEEERLDEMGSDEVYEEEKITTLDDEYRDRGLHRGMF